MRIFHGASFPVTGMIQKTSEYLLSFFLSFTEILSAWYQELNTISYAIILSASSHRVLFFHIQYFSYMAEGYSMMIMAKEGILIDRKCLFLIVLEKEEITGRNFAT
jgi:hypothetical protein